jgi:hypothetical protein
MTSIVYARDFAFIDIHASWPDPSVGIDETTLLPDPKKASILRITYVPQEDIPHYLLLWN